MNILHKPEQRRFEVVLEGGETAVLEYTLSGQTMTITHTYVPSATRGRGVAGQMTEAALEYAHEQGLAVVPLCSFAVRYMAREARRSKKG